jgi:recombination protein U
MYFRFAFSAPLSFSREGKNVEGGQVAVKGSAVVYANRGRALEELIERANVLYRAGRTAVIHKVPTAWVPIRNRAGRITAAKVEEKAAVDFIGHILLPGGPLPLAFDAKEVASGRRWPLARLGEHQYEYLADCAATGAFAFVLIAFWQVRGFFVLPFAVLERCWRAWRAGGPASVGPADPGLVRVHFPRYLDFLYSTGEGVAAGGRPQGRS